MSTAPTGVPGPPPLSLEHPELPAGVEPTPAGPRWPAWNAPAALVAAFGASLTCGIAVYIVALGAGADMDDPPPAVNILATFFQDLCFIGAAVVIAWLSGRPRAWYFGLRRTRFWPALGWGVVVWVSFLILTALWTLLMENAFGVKQESQDILDALGVDEGALALVLTAVLVCVMAPLAEEFLFRGFFFTALRSWRGIWPAAIITGLVFGVIHVLSSPAVFIVPLAIFGLGLCLLYAKTGSLYPCIAVHALNNSLAFGVSEHWAAAEVLALVAGALACVTVVLLIVRRVTGPAPAGLASALR